VPPSRARPLTVSTAASHSAGPATGVPDVTEHTDRGTIRVPDLQGRLGRDAVERLLTAALQPRVSGTGRVVSQSPPAGSIVEKGSRVTLELGLRH
jgi:cell division protein FtsI (penicillin-binding protein 3)